jgi:GrpB-like predicted nucleotidyltransferase (UPF0157 family)
MPPPIPVFLAPYHPAWPKMAADHAARLQALGSTLVAVHHIGSTSVSGLAAKPIIDLMPLVTNLDDLDRKRSLVETGIQLARRTRDSRKALLCVVR